MVAFIELAEILLGSEDETVLGRDLPVDPSDVLELLGSELVHLLLQSL